MKKLFFFVFATILLTACSKSDGGTGSENVFQRTIVTDNHIEYRTGNAPFILTVPHGGTLDDTSLVKRTESNCPDPQFTTVRDSYTIELANMIESAFVEKTGKYPFMVIGKISRKYVDFNRKKEYAIPTDAAGNALVWDTFHENTKLAVTAVGEKFGEGLLLDIHGHGHDVKQVEIGYLLKAAELNLTDSELASDDQYATKSSICRLVHNNKSGSSFVELLRGTYSFGSLMYKYGLACVPHSENPSPGNLSYFNGGYNSSTYGSSNNKGLIDAIQLEFDSKARTSDNRKKTATAIADAVIEFINKHYPNLSL